MGLSSELFLMIHEGISETVSKVENGELSNLDGLIELRKAKTQLDKGLEYIKEFEDRRINDITIEAEQYGGKYHGFEIKSVSCRKLYNFKGIDEVEKAKYILSNTEDKYKNAFEGFQKGIVQTTEVDGILHWIDSDGSINKFPELSIGKSYLTIKQK